jgi:hypothetical protein
MNDRSVKDLRFMLAPFDGIGVAPYLVAGVRVAESV